MALEDSNDSKDAVTLKGEKAPQEVLRPKEPPAARKEATPAAPPTGAAKLAPLPPPGSPRAAGGAARMGVPPSPFAKQAGLGAAKLGATTPLAGSANKPPTVKSPAVKPPAADKSAAADKTAVADQTASADKTSAVDKTSVVDKSAPVLEKAVAAAARAAPPERRRALEDSVVTSAPKLAADAPRGAAAARQPAKAAAKTAHVNPFANAKERTSADKVAPAAPPAGSELSGVPALRPRRDHNKSPGFYSSVSPAHGSHAVSGGPFAPVPAPSQKPTVSGLAPPPDPLERTVAARADIPEADPALQQPSLADATQTDPLSAVAAPVVDAATLESEEAGAMEAVGEWASMVADDMFAPPQPCSTPPSVSPVAREEKEETSPGLGAARSPHDPNPSSQVSRTDLELLLAFALDLALGCASEAWFVPLRAAVGRLMAGDAAIRSPALERALTTLANDLEQPGAFREDHRQRLYGHVVAVDLALSKRLDVTGQKAIRERLIVEQLLEELAQAHPLLTRRLRDQGLLSLENLGRLSAADLSARLEEPADTAAQVAGIFQSYLEARVQRGPTVALLGKSVALKERLSALEASAEAFERASEGEDSGARRRTRKQRQTDVTQLNLLLAEFGEAKTLAEIERCSVQAKIERLQRWIGEQETSSGRRASKPLSAP
ncbi:MAG: hypothetical protein ABI895_25210 [Deltaproteobacteria bacterium]